MHSAGAAVVEGGMAEGGGEGTGDRDRYESPPRRAGAFSHHASFLPLSSTSSCSVPESDLGPSLDPREGSWIPRSASLRGHPNGSAVCRPSSLKEGGHPRINLVSLHPITILPAICRPSISSHRPVCAIADHHPQPYASRLLRRLHTVLASEPPDCSSSHQEAAISGRSPLYLPIPSPGHQRVTERRRPPPLAPPTPA